jgi:hypothetical protein
VSETWVLVAPLESAAVLARVRPTTGLEILEQADSLWLRGCSRDDELDRQLRLIPGGRRFCVMADGQTVPAGKLVPLGRLPEGTWTPLAEWLELALPAAIAAPPPRIPPQPLRLVPTGQMREPALLETSLAEWCRYVETAPQWRIDCWTFAATADGQVIVRGLPLPPLPGLQWVVEEGVALPAGYEWSPPVDALTLQQALGLAAGELALLRPDGSWDRVAADDWTRASRSAARATREVLSA